MDSLRLFRIIAMYIHRLSEYRLALQKVWYAQYLFDFIGAIAKSGGKTLARMLNMKMPLTVLFHVPNLTNFLVISQRFRCYQKICLAEKIFVWCIWYWILGKPGFKQRLCRFAYTRVFNRCMPSLFRQGNFTPCQSNAAYRANNAP